MTKDNLKDVTANSTNTVLYAGLRHKLDFGKYKGKTVKAILDEDPSYLVWAHEETDRLRLRKDIYQKASDLKEEIDSERHADMGWGDWSDMH